MQEEGCDEDEREGDCVTSRRRDLKVIKQFKTSEGIFLFCFCYSFFTFSSRCSRKYLQTKKYPGHIGEEQKLNFICVLLQEITEVMDSLVLISSNSSASLLACRKAKPTQI